MGDRFQIDVADPCSGLHSLLPFLMFSSFYCYFFLPRNWQKWTVFLSSFLFTIAGNVTRIVMLVSGCLLWGSAFAIGTNDEASTYHEGCGFAVFVVGLGLECLFGYLLVVADRRWSKRPRLSNAVPLDSPAREESSTAIPAWRSGTVLGLAAVMLIIFAVSPPVLLPMEAGVVMDLPDQVKLPGMDGGDFFGSPAEVSEVEHKMLPKDTEFERKNYEDFHEHHIFFSIVLSGVQQYTIHPPEVCLVAQGWSIAGQEDIPLELESGHRLVVRNLSLQRDLLDREHQRRTVKAYYMYWYVADNLTTPSHLERNLVSSWDRVVHNRDHRWAYVIAMSPITQSLFPGGMTPAETRNMLTAFIRQIVPTFQKSELRSYTANP
jgi:exosortase/archaeosortase family protein